MEITAVAPAKLRVNDVIVNQDRNCMSRVLSVAPLSGSHLIQVKLRNTDGSDSYVVLHPRGSVSVFG